MGYNTDFYGSFSVKPPLTAEHVGYLTRFSQTRRMKRDTERLPDDHLAMRLGLGHGPEGAYYVEDDDRAVVDHNEPPEGQPGLWCQWVPSADGKEIDWDTGEKFYEADRWIAYLIKHFLAPWGYNVSGRVEAQGDDHGDVWAIEIRDNVVYSVSQEIRDQEVRLVEVD